MKNKGLSLRRCEIVSKLVDEEGNVFFDMENMKTQLEKRDCIQDYCYIIHDKDVYTEQEEEKNPTHVAGELKPAHIHLLLRFKKNQPQKLHCVSEWFQIAENFVSKIKGSWESGVAYQTHLNAPDKYQYPMEEVTANFDVGTVLGNYQQKQSLNTILLRIINGDIKEYEKATEIPPLMQIQYAREIREAFKCRTEYLQATVKHRQMECIFITGTSQSGKTTLAKQIAESRNYSYYISSGGSDFMGEFSMQDCVILDELRPSVLSLSELLKLLDNNTVTSVKSRYKNKCLATCKLLIITTVLDIDTFYSNVFSEENEPIIQFKRRCSTHIRMDKERIYVSKWDAKKMAYTEEIEYINDIVAEYMPKENQSEQDVIEYVSSSMPFLTQAKEKEKLHGFQSIEDLENPFC